MKQVKTVIVMLRFTGFGGEKDAEKFDNAVNRAIEEIDGKVVDVKYYSLVRFSALLSGYA